MNPFYSALEQGYSPEELIGYIQKAFPKFAEPIKKATKAGYSIQTILGFLSKNFDNENRAGMSESERHAANRRANTERVKFGLQVAGTALIAPFVASAAKGALSRALPNSLANLLSNDISPAGPQQPGALVSPQINQPTTPGATNPLQSASAPTPQTPQIAGQLPTVSQQPPIAPQAQPPVSPTIAQPSQPVQPETITIKPADVLSKHNIKEKVDQILKAKNNPQSVSAYFEKFDSKSKKRIEKETGMPFEKVIEEYASEQAQVPEVAKEEIAEPKEEAKPIEKDSIVSTPHGVGEVKSIKEKNALVEVNGKLQKVPVEELEQSPISEKDLADLHDELLRGIEAETGEDVSRMVQWAGYNPETNTLQFLPHTGKMYKYANISPEDAALLRDVLSVRKTSGSNFIGAWKAGSKSPIGAALSKLIRKLQSERGGKGKEYEETHETLYSAYEPAIEFKKKKKKKK